MMYDLPTSLEVCGTEYPIETDFRVILDIFSVLSAVELTSEEKCIGVLGMFYPGFFYYAWGARGRSDKTVLLVYQWRK